MLDEQRLLRISIVGTFVVAAFGIALGLLSGSFSIAFDGVYSLADAGMTALALSISGLIVRSARHESGSRTPDSCRVEAPTSTICACPAPWTWRSSEAPTPTPACGA